jgi:hypothetical protein
MNYLLNTVAVPNYIIVLYWVSLGIAVLVAFIYHIKYYSMKFRVRNEKEKEAKLRKDGNPKI